jgi:hypothetical protein
MPLIVLSSHGLNRADSVPEGNFAFIGNDCTVQCTKFQAAFISPRVHSLLQTDASLDSFFIELQTKNVPEKRTLEVLEQLMKGSRIDLPDSEVDAFLDMAGFLDNYELLEQFIQNESPLHEKTVWSRLRLKCALGRSVDLEIDFVASHFYELDFADLRLIDISVLERILSSKSLTLRSEDSLLDFICSVEWDDEACLLRQLRIEYLSCESMKLFVDRLYDLTVDPILWHSICQRLCLPVSHSRGFRTAELVTIDEFEIDGFEVDRDGRHFSSGRRKATGEKVSIFEWEVRDDPLGDTSFARSVSIQSQLNLP